MSCNNNNNGGPMTTVNEECLRGSLIVYTLKNGGPMTTMLLEVVHTSENGGLMTIINEECLRGSSYPKEWWSNDHQD